MSASNWEVIDRTGFAALLESNFNGSADGVSDHANSLTVGCRWGGGLSEQTQLASR